MTKYRQSKIKRKHHVIKELEAGLAFLSGLDSVDGIIPGKIHPKGGGKIGFTFQYWTKSGLKLLGRSSGAVQEVFVISGDPHAVLNAFQQAGFLEPGPPIAPPSG